MKYYCSKCNVTHDALLTETDDVHDEQYDVCPSCKSDMDLIQEDQLGFIDGAKGNNVKRVVGNYKPYKPISEQEYWERIRIKEEKEDAWIESHINK